MPFADHNNQCKVCHTKQLRIEFIIASENHRHNGSVWRTAEPNKARGMKSRRVIEFESGSKKPPSTSAIKIYWILCATKHFTLFFSLGPTHAHILHIYIKYTFRIDELLLLAILFSFCSLAFVWRRRIPWQCCANLQTRTMDSNICCSRFYNKGLLTFFHILCTHHNRNDLFALASSTSWLQWGWGEKGDGIVSGCENERWGDRSINSNRNCIGIELSCNKMEMILMAMAEAIVIVMMMTMVMLHISF